MSVTQRATADRLISGKGQPITLSWTSGVSYNTTSASVSGGTPTTIETTAALLPLDKSRKIDGTDIAAGDETLLISALDNNGASYAEPPVNSVVTLVDGTKRVIIAIEALAPAGMVIMFDAVVRKTP